MRLLCLQGYLTNIDDEHSFAWLLPGELLALLSRHVPGHDPKLEKPLFRKQYTYLLISTRQNGSIQGSLSRWWSPVDLLWGMASGWTFCWYNLSFFTCLDNVYTILCRCFCCCCCCCRRRRCCCCCCRRRCCYCCPCVTQKWFLWQHVFVDLSWANGSA